MPYLNLESRAWRDRIDPPVLLQQTETDDRGLIQTLTGNLDAVANARWPRAADRACFQRHVDSVADSPSFRLLEPDKLGRKKKDRLSQGESLGQ